MPNTSRRRFGPQGEIPKAKKNGPQMKSPQYVREQVVCLRQRSSFSLAHIDSQCCLRPHRSCGPGLVNLIPHLFVSDRCGLQVDGPLCPDSFNTERSFGACNANARRARHVIQPPEIPRGHAARVVFCREAKGSRAKTSDSAQPRNPSLLNATTVSAPEITQTTKASHVKTLGLL